MNIFKKLKAYLRFREAVRRANVAHAVDSQRYYVLPSPDGNLIIMNRKNFRILRRKGYIDRNAYIKGLEKGCLYCTPYANGTGAMDEDTIKESRQRYYQMLE